MSQEMEKIDRSASFRRLNERLVVDPRKTALITIDMQRGALDPEYATLAVSDDLAGTLLETMKKSLAGARAKGIPVIHVLTFWHAVELARHPFERAILEEKVSLTPARQSDYGRHKLLGSPGAEIMPGLIEDGTDYVVDSKRTFDMFYGTHLEVLLRALDVDTLVITGVNTNTCVQCSAFGAYNRGYRVIVLSDCTASAYGGDLHVFAHENIARRLGWVLSSDEFLQKIEAHGPQRAEATR